MFLKTANGTPAIKLIKQVGWKMARVEGETYTEPEYIIPNGTYF